MVWPFFGYIYLFVHEYFITRVLEENSKRTGQVIYKKFRTKIFFLLKTGNLDLYFRISGNCVCKSLVIDFGILIKICVLLSN